ncbi:hypothetical protein R1flu_028809 [Riccia fluitans]|uniref:Uncharacterized protein n=1 Tax=Riccia fluitans TaxID=41844 RepID=A0ABD1XMS2_9MARC
MLLRFTAWSKLLFVLGHQAAHGPSEHGSTFTSNGEVKVQRSRPKPLHAAEKTIVSTDFLRSLRGCLARRLRFGMDTHSGLSYITFNVKRKGDLTGQAEIVLFERNGYHYFDGREETFRSTVTLLRREISCEKGSKLSTYRSWIFKRSRRDNPSWNMIASGPRHCTQHSFR